MLIDWSKAPENCVGALVAKVGNIHFPKVTFAKSAVHEQSRVRGESCDGAPLCAYLDLWAWEDKPWTGEGLPPVGAVCELTEKVLLADEEDAEWFEEGTQVEVGGHAFFRTAEAEVSVCTICVVGQNFTGTLTEKCLRPIRTPEQIAEEERAIAIDDLMRTTCINHGEAARIYDAGYRKQATP